MLKQILGNIIYRPANWINHLNQSRKLDTGKILFCIRNVFNILFFLLKSITFHISISCLIL